MKISHKLEIALKIKITRCRQY